MNAIAIAVIVVCLMAFFAIFVLWILHLFGKVSIPENQLSKIFALGVVTILTVSGGFISTVFHHTQYEVDPYLGFMSDNGKIQLALKQHGVYREEIDGVLGNASLRAVSDFQKQTNSLQVTGGIDEATFKALFEYKGEPPFSWKRYSKRVKRIQKIFLGEGILNAEEVDGIYDDEFLRAVGEFQSKYGLRHDQDLGTDTLLKIVEYELNVFKRFEKSTGFMTDE